MRNQLSVTPHSGLRTPNFANVDRRCQARRFDPGVAATSSKRCGWRGTMIKPQLRMLSGERLKCFDRQLLFRSLRAAGEKDDVVGRDTGQLRSVWVCGLLRSV